MRLSVFVKGITGLSELLSIQNQSWESELQEKQELVPKNELHFFLLELLTSLTPQDFGIHISMK